MCFSLCLRKAIIFHIIFSENAKTLSVNGKGFTCYKLNNSLSSFDLAGAETTRANRYGLVCSVNNGANLSDVCFPGSACFTVGVRNIVSESNTFTAAHTFCHILHLPRKIRTIITRALKFPWVHLNTALVIISYPF